MRQSQNTCKQNLIDELTKYAYDPIASSENDPNMRYLELLEAARRPFYDPAAIWLHGGPMTLKGDALKRYGRSGQDAGALFFCKDIPVGRFYTASYAKPFMGEQGRVWKVKLLAPVDTILDTTNPKHIRRLRVALSPDELNFIMESRGDSGYMDWNVVDEEQLEPLGFRGCVIQERPKGMATGWPPTSGMATLPEAVISVGIFFHEDAQIIGFVPEEKLHDFFRKD